VKRRFRLRRRADFQTAVRGKRIYSGKALVAFAVPNDGEDWRVGVTVSRAIKSSVDRNRARRRLREVSRTHLFAGDSPVTRQGIPFDVVLIARPAALEVSYADLKAEASLVAMRLSSLNS
jgi:ribonuclease P protein component